MALIMIAQRLQCGKRYILAQKSECTSLSQSDLLQQVTFLIFAPVVFVNYTQFAIIK